MANHRVQQAEFATRQVQWLSFDDGLDGDETLNTATATLNGLGFSGTAAVSYQIGSEINAEVNVTDDMFDHGLEDVTRLPALAEGDASTVVDVEGHRISKVRIEHVEPVSPTGR